MYVLSFFLIGVHFKTVICAISIPVYLMSLLLVFFIQYLDLLYVRFDYYRVI